MIHCDWKEKDDASYWYILTDSTSNTSCLPFLEHSLKLSKSFVHVDTMFLLAVGKNKKIECTQTNTFGYNVLLNQTCYTEICISQCKAVV